MLWSDVVPTSSANAEPSTPASAAAVETITASRRGGVDLAETILTMK